jgi:hypothetical protein
MSTLFSKILRKILSDLRCIWKYLRCIDRGIAFVIVFDDRYSAFPYQGKRRERKACYFLISD